MPSVIAAGTTSNTALNFTADTTGVLQLQTNGTTAAVTIDTSQNVGIGTASPSFTLDISTASSTTARIKSTGNYSYFRLDSSTATGGGAVMCWQNGVQKAVFGVSGACLGDTSGDAMVFAETGQGIRFTTNGSTERMRIDSSGRVGIGISTTNQQLAIAGTANATYSSASGMVVNLLSSSTSVVVPIGFSWSGSIANTSPYWGMGFIPTNFGSGLGDLGFYTSATERMRITSSGLVGIGTASPNSGSLVTFESNGGQIRLRNTTTRYRSDFSVGASGGLNINAYDDTGGVYQTVALDGNPIGFNISGSERARFDSSGNLIVAKTTTADTTVGATMQNSGRIAGTMAASTNATDTMTVYSTGAGLYRFYLGMGGTIYATSTTITGISDQRLKENIVDLPDGLDAVMALKPRKFDWKEGKGKNIKGDRGFIAQEFETVFPDMIETWKDPAPEGEEPYKGVNPNLIPTLVKAIQEQQAMIEELKQEVAALKGVN